MGALIAKFGPPPPDESSFRTIVAQQSGYTVPKEQELIPDNAITTSKYNIITFVPRSLFEQFRRAANIYFLVISILMLLGTYTPLFESPLDPFSTLFPLIMVLIITMGKEGMEDLKRHRSDFNVNNKKQAAVLSTAEAGAFEYMPWRQVRVGMIIQVRNGEEIPADLILLTSSEDNGVAYVETSNIDGETNLKIRSSAPTRDGTPPGPAWSKPEDLHDEIMSVEYERPNPRIHFFAGTLMLDGKAGEAERGMGQGKGRRNVPVDQSNMLLRGSTVRNCKWALGLAVYTGKETKIIKNARSAPSKRSSVDRTTNRIMVVIFIAMAIITTTTLFGYFIFKAVYQSELTYLCFDTNGKSGIIPENCQEEATGADILYWFTFLILYNNFIPISLYVTLEIVNAVQADYIDQDVEMYDEGQDTPALARTSNMNADLGQVQYVFSDKTGTLTQNCMKFKRCSVGGNVYGEVTAAEKEKMTPMQVARVLDAPPLTALKDAVLNMVQQPGPTGKHSAEVEFAMCLAVNHTVVVEVNETTGKKSMQSESPDEEALVAGAAALGIEFVGRTPGSVITRIGGILEQKHELLATIPFDSTRKRMSVVVRDPDGRYLVYCKGADNVILDRAQSFVGATIETIGVQLGVFAEDGLRTLLLARRVLDEKSYHAWAEVYKTAMCTVEGRNEKVAEAAALIECELEVVGVTAIEDKLQDDVPNCIADLGKAGIKVWVLTGDKEETAINIGYSCRLLEPHMTIIKIKERPGDPDSVERQIAGLVAHFGRVAEESQVFQRQWGKVLRSVSPTREKGAPATAPSPPSGTLPQPLLTPNTQQSSSSLFGDLPPLNVSSDALALVVDGPSLMSVLGHSEKQAMFLRIACMCKSVVACRVSPAQKRLLVRLVKKGVKPKPITLAIGDGANDVGMIQEAQVGVGISGKEGRQAVNNSDFAIAQFRFLRRLLLVHGHWDYRRLCKVILYSFYKNIALTFILFYYCFYTGFSGQSLYESLVYSGYNFFLAMPILCVGLFDKDVEDKTAMAAHKLYQIGRENMDLNVRQATRWIVQAIADSLIIFFLPVAAYGGSGAIFSDKGQQDGLYVFGTTVYTCLIVSMMFKVSTMTWTWNIVGSSMIVASLLLYFSFILVYSSVLEYAYDFYAIAYELFARAAFWLIVIQVSIVVWSLDLFIRWYVHVFKPTIGDHAIEFDRGYTSSKGLDLLQALRESAVRAEARAAQEAADHPEPQLDEATGSIILNTGALRAVTESMSAEAKRELGITEGNAAEVRSSYAYDHISTGTASATAVDIGDEILSTIGENDDDEEGVSTLFRNAATRGNVSQAVRELQVSRRAVRALEASRLRRMARQSAQENAQDGGLAPQGQGGASV